MSTRVESVEVDHDVTFVVRFRRNGIPGDPRQVAAFIKTLNRSLELSFGTLLQSVTPADTIKGIMYCTEHDDVANECDNGDICLGSDGRECVLVDIFYGAGQ